ncbi:MAG: type III-B CRISPR module RAMP protein Cmr1 [Treponema sp.]|nr:type III-B CRISPR module RAMP protein Cmr1 [Treponema sp.]
MREVKPAPNINILELDAPLSGRTDKTYEIKVITPIYGGWAQTGKYDEDNIIRAFSVRGNLRFWWRATRGARFKEYKKLFEEESKIWGSVKSKAEELEDWVSSKPEKTTPPTKVRVKVTSNKLDYRKLEDKTGKLNKKGKPENSAYGFGRNKEESYVLFPVIPTEKEKIENKGFEYKLIREGLTFEVTLSYEKEYEKDVLCALWAWVNFGGIGSRTRRGCGALYCDDFAPSKIESIDTWFKDNIDKKKYDLNLNIMRDWATLSNKVFIGSIKSDPLAAWKESIAPMKSFRQGECFGRDERSDKQKPAGRSRWPEPDTLRKLFPSKNGEYTHSPRDFVPFGFPRAALGLPIGFKFIDGDGPNGDDGKGLKIKPVESERMASPVILRPLKTGNGVLPMIVLLNSKPPSNIEIPKTEHKFSFEEEVRNTKFIKPEYTDSPMMKGKTTSGDAVEAFLDFACKKHSFEEVKL